MARAYVVALEAPREGEPLYASIARTLANDIARGRLKKGARLPGSRSLAAMLGVNRNTIHAALAELTAQGWIEAVPARGVFVRSLDDAQPRPFSRAVALRERVPARLGFELAQSEPFAIAKWAPAGLLNLVGGVPDPRLFPHERLARAYRSALRKRSAHLLGYGDPFGEISLRTALSEMLTRVRGLAASADEVLVTRGSQQAIWLAAHSLLEPGARIGVESFGYPPAWEAFRSTGATLVPLAVDGEGMRVEAVARALSEGPLRAIYLTPHHQYPTMVALSAERRLHLLELARKHRFAILEDDYTHEFQYEARPRLPMASADRAGVVVYIGTLSKIFAPSLRIGYAVAPRPLLERMAAQRTIVDRQGDTTVEAAVGCLIEEGELDRHTRRMRRVYRERRDLLVEELRARFGDRLSFEVPAGGMSLWVRVHGTDPRAWAERTRARGVLIRPGSHLTLDGRDVPFVRLGYTALDERELVRAVREAAAAF